MHIMLFFGFFAAVFLLCAAAEWLFAKEALKYVRGQSKSRGETNLLAAVVVSDGISIVLNVIGWCWAYASLNNGWLICSSTLRGDLMDSILLSVPAAPITWFITALGGPLVEIIEFSCPPVVFLGPFSLPVGLLSFASPIMRAKIMWQSACRPWLKWLKLLFVVYTTFWPAALAIPFMTSR